ncbi:hypothetical protein [Synechococcus sp. H65.1]|uniref:hypothetical protein n=1 Tax=unclassified Synechococcus TaxID=2626047 RepID=UPI0039C4216D
MVGTRTQLGENRVEAKSILVAVGLILSLASFYFGTRNGFYDTDKYHGNGSAH